MRQSRRRKQREPKGLGNAERCSVITRYLTRLANRHPRVLLARERLFGDAAATVEPEEAAKLIASPSPTLAGHAENVAAFFGWQVTDALRFIITGSAPP